MLHSRRVAALFSGTFRRSFSWLAGPYIFLTSWPRSDLSALIDVNSIPAQKRERFVIQNEAAGISMQILIVEDESKLALALQQGLVEEGYKADVALSGEEALEWLSRRHPDLLLLDVMLPQRNGLSVLRELRREGFHVPVLLLTALDSVQDRVLGLDAGGDDYLVKPFAFSELLARVRALLRRNAATPQSALDLADLHLDLSGRVVSRKGSEIEVTSREFDLLEYLMLNRNRVVSREMLARDVWKEMSRYTSLDNVIDVQVARLRRKIDDPFDLKLLHTVRGVGFVLRED
jgi:DNA-binding response OmpR family regulator